MIMMMMMTIIIILLIIMINKVFVEKKLKIFFKRVPSVMEIDCLICSKE